MSPAQRCDEILRLIDDVVADYERTRAAVDRGNRSIAGPPTMVTVALHPGSFGPR
jgi:hypothetical protein